MDPAAPDSFGYERGRAARQAVGLGGALLVMAALAALGAWMIVASHQQYPGRAEAWVGTAFGALFVGLGLLVVATGVGVLRRMRRVASADVLRIDGAGIAGVGGDAVPWDEMVRVEAVAVAPAPHRTSAAARLDAGHRVGLATRRGLDRAVGGPLGLRDGRRTVRVLRRDGSDVVHELTLPLGPDAFGAVVAALERHGAARGIEVIAPR